MTNTNTTETATAKPELRDPLHQDYLDACAYEAEGRQLEQQLGRPVDMFNQPIK